MENKRIEWIDLLKCFAICCVILVHSAENVYVFDLDYMNSIPLHTQIWAFLLFTVGRLGVPIFLMCSGFLLLDREYDTQRTVRFWKKNLLGLFLTTELWVLIYIVFMSRFYEEPVVAGTLVKNVLFLKYMDVSHMWYMPVILGIYLFIPFVAVALHRFSWRIFCFPWSIALAYLGIVPVINVILAISDPDSRLAVLPALEFSGGIYGCILVTGYLVRKGFLGKVKRWLLAVLTVVSVGCTIVIQIYSFHHGEVYKVWYDNIFLIIASICIFTWFARLKQVRFRSLWENLSRCSFGIYLLHNIVIMILKKYVVIASASVRTAVFWGLALGLSWFVVWLVSHNRIAAKVLFFIR